MDRETDSQRHRRRDSILGLFVVALAGTQALGAWRDQHILFVNSSASLANWAFLVERGQSPRKGDYAFFRAPQTDLVTRHFGNDAPPFGKIVYGIGGDKVTRSNNMVLLNGTPIVKLKRFTKRGEILVPGPTGIIPRDCYFMATPHRDGLDSRYADIGFVCRDLIIGTGRAIL